MQHLHQNLPPFRCGQCFEEKTGHKEKSRLNVVADNVVYAIPAAQAGDMIYDRGSTLTVLNKAFLISDIDSIYIDNSAVTDGTVNVTYDGTKAQVVVAGNIMQYLTVNVRGANVSCVQNDNLTEEINYTLTGSSTNGSFYMDGEYKATLTLSALTLTSTDSAAINIENGKRIAVCLKGTNTLADAAQGDQKACFMVNGHSEFTGDGALSITGNGKHGFWSDEYVQLKKTFTGSLTVAGAVKDGMNINQYFKMSNGTLTIASPGDDGIQVTATDNSNDENNGQVVINGGTINVNVTNADCKAIKCDGLMAIADDAGFNTAISITCASTAYAAKGLKSGGDLNISGGTINISTTGKGMWDTEQSETSACAAFKADGNINISGGTCTLSATGAGGKGISSDGHLVISGGRLTVNTSGGCYYHNGTTENTNYTGRTENVSNSYTSSSKGIKADGNISLGEGLVDVTTSGYNAEGIESKAVLNISGGTVHVSAYDDAINCAGNMYISGGEVGVRASNNDGLDANGNIYISGGTVAAFGASAPECAIDAAEGYAVYITGGTVLGVGGSAVRPSSTTTSQAYISTTGTVTASTTVSLSNGSTTLAAFTVPDNYTASSSSGGMRPPGGGGQGGGTYILISAPGMSSGNGYTLTMGSTSKTVTATK